MKYQVVVSKISSATVNDMRAATSASFAKKFLSASRWIRLRFFARFPRLASHFFNLATSLFLRPVPHNHTILGIGLKSIFRSLEDSELSATRLDLRSFDPCIAIARP